MSIGPFPIEAGQVLAFTRAIGDSNPVYTDAAAAAAVGLADIAAPPTFVQAGAHFDPDYALRPNPNVPWFGSGSGPGFVEDRADSVLHAEQHFEYHRPLLVGDVLSTTVRLGDEWEKTGRRGGRLRFGQQITEYRDAAGKLVVTATVVWVRTENNPLEEQA